MGFCGDVGSCADQLKGTSAAAISSSVVLH